MDAKEKKLVSGAAGSDSAKRAAAKWWAITATGGFGRAVWDVVTARQQSRPQELMPLTVRCSDSEVL